MRAGSTAGWKFGPNRGIPNFKYVTSLQILRFEIRFDLSLDR